MTMNLFLETMKTRRSGWKKQIADPHPIHRETILDVGEIETASNKAKLRELLPAGTPKGMAQGSSLTEMKW